MNLTIIRRVALLVWLLLVAGGIYAYVFQRAAVEAHLHSAFSTSALVAYAIYLLLGSFRGFTLIPTTFLVLSAVAFFPPWPLLAVTLVGVVVSSASIYYFSHAMALDRILERHHAARMTKLKTLLQRHELPIIIGWSFFPLVPTDLIVYVCGVLKVDLGKCLLGVLIGEGVICALYIFGADAMLRVLQVR
jgi:uncharacterized membrane protein YdjX (TVP38/TMEM64 family)